MIEDVLILDADEVFYVHEYDSVMQKDRVSVRIKIYGTSYGRLLAKMIDDNNKLQFEDPYTFLLWCETTCRMFLLVNAYLQIVDREDLPSYSDQNWLSVSFMCDSLQFVPYVAHKEAIRMWPNDRS